nr:hypothetical protein [Tanacetum cinerariifolium]
SIEAYDLEAKAKFVTALQALKDLKYSLVDQLESLKDASMDVIMAALYLESDTRDDAQQDLLDLRSSSSQLTIPVYPKERWMSFSKRTRKNTPQCYTKPLDSLKNWNNRFFWVDERVFPTVVDWRTNASKDGKPAESTYSIEAVRALDTHRTPIQKQPEMLLCLVGISRGSAAATSSAWPSPGATEAGTSSNDGISGAAVPWSEAPAS